MDIYSKKFRSWNMSRIHSKNTKPELQVRSLLHSLGYRFRIHSKVLPGKPDIVLNKYKTVIFVHGCFWHRHKHCKYATSPKSNNKFWNLKFANNIDRDIKIKRLLHKAGWKVIVIWQCNLNNIDRIKNKIINSLK